MTTIHFDNTDFTPAILEKCAASRLVELHNTLADKPVKRFADKPTAVKRVWKLLVEYAEQAGVETYHEDDAKAEAGIDAVAAEAIGMTQEEFAEARAADTPQRRASSDRQPTLKNCRFHVNGGKSAPNPFRAGSKSHAAFALVQGQPNISYQEFKAAGGRLRTLTHAVKIGYIRSTEGE